MWTAAVLVPVSFLVAAFATLLVAVRISRKAKPLGGLPYRWGLYLGIAYGIGGFTYLYLGFSALGKGAVPEGIEFLILTLLAEIAAVGTCRRRRWGAVVLIVTQAMIGVVPPLLKAIDEIPNALKAPNNQHAAQKTLIQFFAALVFLIVNVIYFKKRWKLMGSGQVSTQAISSPVPSHNTRRQDGIIYTDTELEAMRERPPQR